jgi:hypothetical protein
MIALETVATTADVPADETLAAAYHFADFTRANYRALLGRARQHYVFRGFADAVSTERFVIWRHDVDYSVHSARALARIEAEEGIRATYFFRLHSELYNLMELPVTALAREIADLGHDVGLHLDTAGYRIDHENDLDEPVAWESAILERLLDRPVVAVSFHQPTPLLLTCQRAQYGGRLNTYAARFQRDVGYVSDSNGYWRHRRLATVLTDASDHCLQVLTHPEWWTDIPMSPAARIERCIAGRATAMRDYYRDDMQRAGRLNVGA